MPSSLDSLFRPSSVAVIGASTDSRNLGNRVVRNLIDSGFQGAIYPVHPRGGTIVDLPVYRSIESLPADISLVVVCVPRDAVLEVVDQCSQAKIRFVVIVSAGFAETDASGAMLQGRLADKAHGDGMRIIGPNCVGVINADPSVRLNTTFCPQKVNPGPVAFCSQSGALGVLALAKGDSFHIGFSQFVSVGNESDVSTAELIEHWGNDDQTGVILLYQESINDVARFREAALRVSGRKPIVAVKAGRQKAGQRAARSHTAALASSQTAVDALFDQTGIIRTDGVDPMLDVAAILAHQPLPAGARVGIITNAGGPAVLCADECERMGLDVPILSRELQTRLAGIVAPPASVSNPIDMLSTAGPKEYREITTILASSDEIDTLVVVYVPVEMIPDSEMVGAICDGVATARQGSAIHRPVVACVMSKNDDRPRFETSSEVIPCFTSPASAAVALGKVADYATWRRRPTGVLQRLENMDLDGARQIIASSRERTVHGWLSGEDLYKIATAAGLPMAPRMFARSLDEAVDAANRISFPVAIKSASASVLHKTEIGAVELNLRNEDELQKAYDRLLERLSLHRHEAGGDCVVVQAMRSGIELMIGATCDPQFGPLLAFGLGGTHVEILNDLCYRLAPITDQEASDMIRSIRGYRLLTGYRGAPPADVPAIEQLLLRISQLVVGIPEICELDLNPVVALPLSEGCQILDARIRVGV